MKKKLATQGQVLRGGIIRICLSLSNKQNPCHESQVGTRKVL